MDNSFKAPPPPPKSIQSGEEYFTDDYGLEIEDYGDYEDFGMEEETTAPSEASSSDIYQEIDKLTSLARSQGASAEVLKALEDKKRLALQSANLSPEKREATIETIRMELGELEGRISLEIEQAPARDALKKEIQELRAELESEVKDGDQKEAIEKGIQEAEAALSQADLEAAEESLGEAKEELETAKEENPPFAKRLSSQLSDAKINVSEKDVEQALKDSGLSEEDISDLRLPVSAEKSTKLLDFFKKVDPYFAEQFANKPYGEYSMKELSILLKQTLDLPAEPTKEELEKFLEPYVPVQWNMEKVREGLSPGGKDLQNKILGLLDKAVRTGNTSELHDLIWSGHNDVDRAHHSYNDVIRSIVSSIYELADRNPQLMKRFLKLIPKQILQDFRDVVIAHSGELNEKKPGDLVTSQEAYDILDWALTDGAPPAFFSGGASTGTTQS